MNQKDMQEVISGAQKCRVNLAEARDWMRSELDVVKRERNRLQNAVDHYAETIKGLNEKLKESQQETAKAKAATLVMKGMAVDARSCDLALGAYLGLVDGVLNVISVEDDSDAMKELRQFHNALKEDHTR